MQRLINSNIALFIYIFFFSLFSHVGYTLAEEDIKDSGRIDVEGKIEKKCALLLPDTNVDLSLEGGNLLGQFSFSSICNYPASHEVTLRGDKNLVHRNQTAKVPFSLSFSQGLITDDKVRYTSESCEEKTVVCQIRGNLKPENYAEGTYTATIILTLQAT